MKFNIISFVIITIVTLNMTLNVLGKTNQENLFDEWHPFSLLKCDILYVSIFKLNSEINVEHIIDIDLYNLSSVKLTLDYQVKNEGGFTKKTENINKLGLSTFVIISNEARLTLTNEKQQPLIPTLIKVSGKFRLDNGEWKSFSLQKCFPYRLTIHQNLTYKNELKLNLNVTDINIDINTELILSYSYSDLPIRKTISKKSNNTFIFNSTTTSLNLYNNGSVSGVYKIEVLNDFDLELNFGLYFVLSLFIYSGIRYGRKIKN